MQRILSILALAVILPTAAMAQRPQTREGFGISVGIGAGSAIFTCDGCGGSSEGGPSGYLRLGGYVSPSVLLAAESDGWTSGYAGIGAIMGVVQWYPMVTNGFYLKGGIGFSSASFSPLVFFGDPITLYSASGFAASIGAGYDWRVARNFALTPFVNYLQQLGGTCSDCYDLEPGQDAEVHVFQFGLGFTWF